jgi:hypothetical protein
MAAIEFLRPDGLLRSPAFSWVAVVPPGATTIHVGGINATDVDGNLIGDRGRRALSAEHSRSHGSLNARGV